MNQVPRPTISEYTSPEQFVGDMLRYRKSTEKGFSVLSATKSLRKISPTLVSLILQKKRKLTVDRCEEFAKLLNLNASEKTFLRRWVGRLENQDFLEGDNGDPLSSHRREVSVDLLTDWLNAYVKDFFQIQTVQDDPARLDSLLAHVARPQRIKKSIDFLLKEGYLRRDLQGRIVLNDRLSVAEPKSSSRKIRAFHKGALELARQALDLYALEERLANTLLIPLNESSRAELLALIEDFAERLKEFAAQNNEPGNRLYQLILNLSPIGGKLE